MEKLECIYSFDHKEQDFITFDNPGIIALINCKNDLVEVLTHFLNKTDLMNLYKISCCVISENMELSDLPQWFLDCNGKLFFANGVVD